MNNVARKIILGAYYLQKNFNQTHEDASAVGMLTHATTIWSALIFWAIFGKLSNGVFSDDVYIALFIAIYTATYFSMMNVFSKIYNKIGETKEKHYQVYPEFEGNISRGHCILYVLLYFIISIASMLKVFFYSAELIFGPQ